jgi:hypothetical protein
MQSAIMEVEISRKHHWDSKTDMLLMSENAVTMLLDEQAGLKRNQAQRQLRGGRIKLMNKGH